MIVTLKTTIYASAALAGLLNLANFSVSANQRIQASFVPSSTQGIADTSGNTAAARPEATAQAVGTVAPSPEAAATATTTINDPAARAAAILAAAGLKTDFAASYLAVQTQTGTPWQLVAAVHSVETGQSDNTARSSGAGAKGPMQFMPGTWKAYALDGDGNATADITDVDDALLTGGRYLAAGGADKGKYQAALYNYNHSNVYVSNVLNITRKLGL